MDVKLVVAKGKTTVREIALAAEKTIIGRKNDCSLRIPSPLVSRQHCELTRNGDSLVVNDLGSSNGTFVNGARVQTKQLQAGDTLGVGPITFIVQFGDKVPSPGDTVRPAGAPAEAAEEAVAVDDASDFVVAEEVSADAGADFVVALEDDTADLSDDGTSAAAPAGDDLDFVVAEDADGEDTVHDDSRQKAAVVADDPDTVILDEAVATPPAEPVEAAETPKKGGLFGKLFGKGKNKKGAPPEPPPPAPAATPPPAAAAQPVAAAQRSKAKAVPAPPAPPPPARAEAETPDFVTADDESPAATAQVADDELADFLMDLNKKEDD